ncbi:MAG: FkbM family methyltransferase, partial [Bacteroidota bacterium]
MKKIIDKVIRGSLATSGKIAVYHTPADKIKALARLIYPVKTDKPLIRLGGQRDGGYLVPDDLEGISACFSPGVDQVSEFELACINRGMHVYLADQSVDAPGTDLPEGKFTFLKKFIGPAEKEGYTTMEQWVGNSEVTNGEELLLQMDVEGAEYYTILSMSDDLISRFRIIVVEFHWLDQLWQKPFFHLVMAVLEKLTRNHTCVHNHPNNFYPRPHWFKEVPIPRLMELTFLRNDRINEKSFTNQFPHPLD